MRNRRNVTIDQEFYRIEAIANRLLEILQTPPHIQFDDELTLDQATVDAINRAPEIGIDNLCA